MREIIRIVHNVNTNTKSITKYCKRTNHFLIKIILLIFSDDGVADSGKNFGYNYEPYGYDHHNDGYGYGRCCNGNDRYGYDGYRGY